MVAPASRGFIRASCPKPSAVTIYYFSSAVFLSFDCWRNSAGRRIEPARRGCYTRKLSPHFSGCPARNSAADSRRPPSRCNSKMRSASCPQPTTMPVLSAETISPAPPDFSMISAFQIFSRCGFGWAGKNVNAPGQGVKARSRFQMVCAG